jgi:hypothetical protein
MPYPSGTAFRNRTRNIVSVTAARAIDPGCRKVIKAHSSAALASAGLTSLKPAPLWKGQISAGAGGRLRYTSRCSLGKRFYDSTSPLWRGFFFADDRRPPLAEPEAKTSLQSHSSFHVPSHRLTMSTSSSNFKTAQAALVALDGKCANTSWLALI